MVILDLLAVLLYLHRLPTVDLMILSYFQIYQKFTYLNQMLQNVYHQ
jgi:hypothetical protein